MRSVNPSSRVLGVNLFSVRLGSLIPKLIVLLTVVFVFEEAVYGRLVFNSTAYILAKTASEAIAYLLLLFVVMHNFVRNRLWFYKPNAFDACALIFIIVAIVSTVVSNGSLSQGAINVRTMLRYVAVYYIIVITGWVPTAKQVEKFIKLLVITALIQVLFIVIQHYAGDSFREAYFSPAKIEVEVAGVKKILGVMENKIGAGYGTFGKTPLAAFYLLFVAAIAVAKVLSKPSESKKWWFAYISILIGIYFTYKRAPFLLALTLPILTAWFLGRKRLVRIYISTSLLIIPFCLLLILSVRPDSLIKEKETQISPIVSFSQLFSEEYWAITSSKARGWMIMEVGGQALSSFKLIGYGADEESAKAILAEKGGEFSKLVGWGAFDDVYIVAVLVYYGPIGVGLLIMAFYYIYRRSMLLASMPDHTMRVIGSSLSAIMVLMLLSVFVVRVFEFRAFIFLFWIFSGVVISMSQKCALHNYQVKIFRASFDN